MFRSNILKHHFRAQAGLALLCWTMSSSCLKGPGLFKQEGAGANGSITYAIVTTEAGGVTSGSFDPRSTATQLISAAAGTAISGAGVAFPPGALSIDTTITLQEGSELATGAASAALGLGTSMRKGGPSVVISAGQRIDANIPFSLQLPISSGSGLALGDDSQNIIVIYKVYNAADDKYFTGIYTRDQLDISADSVSVETKFFGAFQVAYTETFIAKPVKVEDETPILTKNDEYKLQVVKWTLGTPEFNESIREVSVDITATGFGEVVRCIAMVFNSKTAAFFDSNATENGDDLKKIQSGGTSYTYRVKSDDAMTLYFKFGCKDTYGRDIESQFSDKIEIAAKPADPVKETDPNSGGGTLSIVGFGDPTSAPTARKIFSGNTASQTISGTCDSSKGNVHVWTRDTYINGSYNDDISCNSGTFSFNVVNESYSIEAPDLLKLKDQVGGHAIKLWQPNSNNDVETILFNVGSSVPANQKNIRVVTTDAELSSARGDTNVDIIVLGNDIDFNSITWSSPSLNKAFDGDNHVIKNLHQPLFSSMTSGRISNVHFENAAISTSGSGVIAVVVSTEACTTSCVISNVSMDASNITITTGAMTGVGLLAGIGSSFLTIESSDIFSSSIVASSGAASFVGLVIGKNYGRISNVWVDGEPGKPNVLTASTSIGGIAGSSNGEIDQCTVNYLNISTTSTGDTYLGGLVGEGQSLGSIGFSSVENMTIIGSGGQKNGGLAGSFIATTGHAITDSFASLNNISGNSSIGGLVGYLYVSSGIGIIDSYSANSMITGAAASATKCGGLVGDASVMSSTLAAIDSSFSFNQNISCAANKGAIFGTAAYETSALNVHFFHPSLACDGNTTALAFTSSQCSSQATAYFANQTSDVYDAGVPWNFTWPWYFPTGAALPRHTFGN